MASPTRRGDSTLLIVTVVVLLLAAPLLFMAFVFPFGMMGWMGVGGWWWPWWIIAGTIIGIVAVIVLILFVIRALEGTPTPAAYVPSWTPAPPPGGAGALDILNARYARGEITREDYLRMRADLERAA